MKKLVPSLLLLLCSFHLSAQETAAYTRLLEVSPELELRDSLTVNHLTRHLKEIDSAMVVQLFSPVLANGSQSVKMKNRDFYSGGKLTSSPHFNLHVLVEDKKKEDSIVLRVVYLVTTKKDGTFISSFKAGVSGIKKKSSYNTSSVLFKDLKILQDSWITTSSTSLNDVARYTITQTGRFMMQLD